MTNRTIVDYCLPYPFEDGSRHGSVYRVQKTISQSMRDSGFNGTSTLYFLINACEAFDDAGSVLRSCLDRPESKTQDTTSCFYCHMNYPFTNASRASEFENCTTPEWIPTDQIFVKAMMSLYNEKG